MQFELNKALKDFNTFHIDAQAEKFICIDDEKSLLEILEFAKKENERIHFIGGGSNILLTQNIDGITFLNQLKGISIINKNEEFVNVNFASGENWHQCVLWAVEHNYGGIENLSLIPGTIGASPIQNIGAYGVELKDVFHSLEAINLISFEKKIFTLNESVQSSESIIVISNGSVLIPQTDYTLTNNITLNLVQAPYNNTKVEVKYFGATNPPGPPGYFGSVGYKGSAGSDGVSHAVISPNPPINPNEGVLWLDSDNGVLNIYYSNEDTWVGIAEGPRGYEGQDGYLGSVGYIGSTGYWGSVGYTGSMGNVNKPRSVVSYTTPTSTLPSKTSNFSFPNVYKGYILYKVQINKAAWVRLYTSEAARTADELRYAGTDPLPDVGVIAEFITSGAYTVTLSPAVLGFNDENPPVEVIPFAITNLTTSTTTFTITLTLVQTEI
jgi:hypothetical protein